MQFQPGPKITCACLECGDKYDLPPFMAKKFKFCSNYCKWKAKEKQIPVNKLPIYKRIMVQCQNPLCNKCRYILPSDHRLGRYKYCSNYCKLYVLTKKFALAVKKHTEIVEVEIKRSIWFIK